MTNLHRSPPLNQSKIDLGIVNESQLLRFGINLTDQPYRRPHFDGGLAGLINCVFWQLSSAVNSQYVGWGK
jgi:hypothetical protein